MGLDLGKEGLMKKRLLLLAQDLSGSLVPWSAWAKVECGREQMNILMGGWEGRRDDMIWYIGNWDIVGMETGHHI
jgi:hypothetical protein